MLVVSGHLEFSLLPGFAPYSFQLALFFFISGYLFKEKYLDDVANFVQRRINSLLVPYFAYNAFYLAVTVLIAKLTGKFWGMEISFKNFFITPFLNGHQFDLSCPLWFVPQLFITLLVFLFMFRLLKKINNLKYFHLGVFLVLCIFGAQLSKLIAVTPTALVVIRTLFSMFFVYLGFFYRQFVEEKHNIFTPRWLGAILALQAILWMFNTDYDPRQGIGLSYILVWAKFNQPVLVSVLTSLTGIWASLFVIKLLSPYLENIKFFQKMGQTTYHIMANHLLVMYALTALFLHLHNIPVAQRAQHDIYWIYDPVKNTFLYFLVTTVVTTYIGVGLQNLGKFFHRQFDRNA